ncbi:flippase [Lyngbya sp. PCC 8106]|uniref:flippase n=1 Tax=Lyngbya sp. (strain PCC 8106) TaxID=313612 RepID=UPI0000EAD194|nr:flippase [Lyngbya sp. PCC 8106]EAW38323.1 hypothetical protein L8106_09876 [Lyngbya sp. PCC 8106]
MIKIIDRIKKRKKNKSSTNNLHRFLLKSATGTFGFKVANAFLIYANSLLLARVLGFQEFGSYTYVTAWVNLLVIPAVLGLEGLLTREVAIYQTQSKWNLSHGLIQWSNRIVLLNSVGLALLTTLIIWGLTLTSNSQQLLVFAIAMISLPFMALSRLRQSTMQALRHIVVGQIPEMLVRPIILITSLGGIAFFLNKNITASGAMGIYLVASITTYLVGEWLLRKHRPKSIKQALPEYQSKYWIKSALPMLLIGSMYLINNQTDTVMLGILKNSETVGLYTVANRGAGLISFVLIAINTAIAPTFASLYAEGDLKKLQKVVTNGCRVVFFAALIIATILMVFGQHFLLLFGAEFIQGKTALIILCLGQLINASTGSVALLLLMTGHERDTAIGVTISALLNILLNVILIPEWGAEGAATATAASMMVWNIILAVFAYKRLKINSTILAIK